MDFKVCTWLILILLGCFLNSSADSDGICEENVMELYTGTRPKIRRKIITFYTWCGTKFCYKPRMVEAKADDDTETFSEWRKRQKCCNGYKESTPGLKPIKCEAICLQDCINANCTLPDVCTCLAGYARKNSHECTPICNNSCVNGECTGPNKCSCNDGYETSGLTHLCMPVCEKKCTNGFCIKPNKCQCFSGFLSEDGSDHDCKPQCKEKCINGFCSAPNFCSCNEGFELDEENNQICNPICTEKCVNGYCSNPDNCTCNHGYISDFDKPKTVCIPLCMKGCRNGKCVAPELCECLDGYKRKDQLTDECLPDCNEGCVNGICTGPDNCTCLEGFINDSNNSSVCVMEAVEMESVISPEMESGNLFPARITTKLEPFHCYKSHYEEALCFSNQKEAAKNEDLTTNNCTDIRKLKFDSHCSCNTTNTSLTCFVDLDIGEDVQKQWQYSVMCERNNYESEIPDVILQVVFNEDSTSGECQWCACPSADIPCTEGGHFSLCKTDIVEGANNKVIPVWLIIVLGLLMTVIFVSAVIGYLLWKRHRRITYALQYKERQNCGPNQNLSFERSGFISEEEESEDEVK